LTGLRWEEERHQDEDYKSEDEESEKEDGVNWEPEHIPLEGGVKSKGKIILIHPLESQLLIILCVFAVWNTPRFVDYECNKGESIIFIKDQC
jgi:hypothetical protein